MSVCSLHRRTIFYIIPIDLYNPTDHNLTNVARVKRTYWGLSILCVHWLYDVSVTWYS